MRRRSTARMLILASVFFGLCFAHAEKPFGVRVFLDLTSPILIEWAIGTTFASAVLFGAVLLSGEFAEAVVRPSCPRCGARRFRRVAIDPFGDRHYRCGECGATASRTLLSEWSMAPELFAGLAASREPESRRVTGTSRGEQRPGSLRSVDPLPRASVIPDLGPEPPIPYGPRVDLLEILVEEGVIGPNDPSTAG